MSAAFVAEHAVRSHGVVLRTELDRTLPRVAGDRVQLQQVLLNLVLNAIEAMSAVHDRPRELTIVSGEDSPNTVRNDGWTNLSLRAEWNTPYGVSLFAAGQNLADRRFSQSVQVDNAAGKYYEPADRRSFYAGLRWSPR